MPEAPPTVYFLYGDHELAFTEFINRLREKMGDSSIAAMNIETFTPSKFSMEKFQEVCTSIPFLAPRRLIILEEPTRIISDTRSRENFYQMLGSLPQTTALVLIENVDFQSSKGKTPKQISELIEWLENHQPSAYIKRFELPHGSQFIRWIQQRTFELGGEIEPQAAQLLAEFVNENPYHVLQELSKLLDYVNRERPIEIKDIEELTPLQRQSDVFAMVDAIGLRNGSEAFLRLRQLLQDESPLYAFSMIVRQFRLLLLVKEAELNLQDPKDALHLHPYVAGKIITQSKNFTLDDLESIYHQLNEMDVASKTGQENLEVALESLVAELTCR